MLTLPGSARIVQREIPEAYVFEHILQGCVNVRGDVLPSMIKRAGERDHPTTRLLWNCS